MTTTHFKIIALVVGLFATGEFIENINIRTQITELQSKAAECESKQQYTQDVQRGLKTFFSGEIPKDHRL